jgi:ATP-dependent RNA helicase DHX57
VATIREITALRHELLSSLISLALIPPSSQINSPFLNVHSYSLPLVSSIVLGGFWPRVARVHLPKSAIKFDKVQAGTVQRENMAKEWKMYDLKEGRVFLHPGSICFEKVKWKSGMLAYFRKVATSKTFLRDVTEVRNVRFIRRFSLISLTGSVICSPFIWRACVCEPCRRGTDCGDER